MNKSFPDLKSDPSRILILDGPVGTELTARGFDVDRPGWSARAIVEAPQLLEEIHQGYVNAGADILTANTFRTHAHNLAEWGQQNQAEELTATAIQIARKTAGNRAWVAGSVAPLGDSYQAETRPDASWYYEQHARMMMYQVHAGVDLLIIETQTNFIELQAAVRSGVESGIPILVSLVTFDGKTMLDGTSLSKVAEWAQNEKLSGIGINCLPVEKVSEAMTALDAVELPKVVYANSGFCDAKGNWQPSAGSNPVKYAAEVKTWINNGVQIIGGCCGTTPVTIAKIADSLRP